MSGPNHFPGAERGDMAEPIEVTVARLDERFNGLQGVITEMAADQRRLTDSYEKLGIWFELRGGDYCDPLFDPDGWFGPKLPKRVLRFFCSIPILPWFSWNVFGKAGYAGFKGYGADSPNYEPWAGKKNVYPGSQALHFSVRNGLTALWLLLPVLLAWMVWG